MPLPPCPGLPDDAYEHDGQLTKREVRAVTPGPAGARCPGSCCGTSAPARAASAIEWMRVHPSVPGRRGRARPTGPRGSRRNAFRLGVPALQVVDGSAPAALDGLPAPDAVFVGGGLTAAGLLDACWAALRPGGRLVVNAVTLESEAVLADWHAPARRRR